MVQQYVKEQPEGFVNRIEKVAIIGATGQLGRHLTDALLKTGKHQVTAISRADSKAALRDDVKGIRVDYDDEAKLVEALVGQDFLIVTLGAATAPDVHSKVVRAAGKAGVRHIMPNIYTGDIVVANKEIGDEVVIGKMQRPLLEEIESVGVSSWTILVTGFWYEFSLACPPEWVGFNLQNKTLEMFDDGQRKVHMTSWLQCARAVAALLSLPLLPSDEGDRSTTLSDFRNKPLYVSSFLISQREMLDSVQRVTDTSDADWTIRNEATSKRVEDGRAQVAGGDMKGFAKAYYSRMFYPGTEGLYQNKLHNGVLNLPEDDLDEATARAVDMAEKGYSPF